MALDPVGTTRQRTRQQFIRGRNLAFGRQRSRATAQGPRILRRQCQRAPYQRHRSEPGLEAGLSVAQRSQGIVRIERGGTCESPFRLGHTLFVAVGETQQLPALDLTRRKSREQLEDRNCKIGAPGAHGIAGELNHPGDFAGLKIASLCALTEPALQLPVAICEHIRLVDRTFFHNP